ncbi:MAG: histidine kinase dimerization/phosphoacceptor domain -containing protein [Syntrophus sp. (in: bacteria)]
MVLTAAFLLQWIFWNSFKPFAWIFFYPAVFFSAWIGGLRCGLASIVFSSLVIWWFFIPNRYSFIIEQPAYAFTMAVFVSIGILFSFTFERLRMANRQVTDVLAAVSAAKDHLEERVSERTTELERTFNALRDSEVRYRRLFEHMAEGYAYCRMILENGEPQDFIYLAVNTAFETLVGLRNVTGKKVSEVIPGIREADPQLFDIYARVSLTGKPEKFEMFVEVLKMWFSVSVYGPEKEHFVAVFDVITDRKRAEKALQESEERFRVAQELSPDGFTILRPVRDSRGRVIDFTWVYENSAIARLNGTDPNSIVGMRLLDLFPGHRGTAILDTYQEVAESGESRIMEVQYQGESIPTPTWFRIVVVSMGSDIAILAQNITERRQAEEQVKSSLKEKEVLLKELQHRVKNNLLTISGILALQLERIKDRESKDIFITSMNRIKAMTRIHTRLYQSDNYSLINFKGYIEELVCELSRTYGFSPENMITNIEDISIDINTAIPTGLIVNELVCNAMKHAFPSLGAEDIGTGQPYRNRKGKITISLKERPDPQPVFAGEAMTENSEAPRSPLLILTVSDNGIGFPAHIDFRNTESVGLSLLVKLVEQINGSMELIRENGTIFIITFSIN